MPASTRRAASDSAPVNGGVAAGAPVTRSAPLESREAPVSVAPSRVLPVARPLETPEDFRRRLAEARRGSAGPRPETVSPGDAGAGAPAATRAATETLAGRAGALSDELDFSGFVASLVHGTFDAVVDSSIRQMEAFADLVSAVTRSADQFTRDNVSRNQAIDWLAERFPRDLVRDVPLGGGAGEPRLRARAAGADGESAESPPWLAEFELEGEELTDDVIEERLIPAARDRIGAGRHQMLATMVLMGMNRINVKDGTIAAKVRFRAAAHDKAAVSYAVAQDPGRPGWGQRGSGTYASAGTMVSTVGVNVQADSDLKAELFGEVKINFASETLPLDRFVDAARIALLQGHARSGERAVAQPGARAETRPEAAESGEASVANGGAR